MTSIKFELEVPPDKLGVVSALFKELQFVLTGADSQPENSTMLTGRMSLADFMLLVITMRDAHPGRTVREAYELSEAVHFRYFRRSMYTDYETFLNAWGRFQRKKVNTLPSRTT